ncbi:type II toxin-antitoxin system HicA family toxin [Geoalkalibacter halelectricus]|uniref:type II toxin-antitoxin system HicA family toxin n=1 Tax=Geoalkalibacter halelectricus TaxID=2847045 RepID=UPI003D2441EC
MPKLYSSRRIIAVLLKHGFVEVSQKGSHKKFRLEDKTVIVPDPRKEIPFGTFLSIVRQAGLHREDFEKFR